MTRFCIWGRGSRRPDEEPVLHDDASWYAGAENIYAMSHALRGKAESSVLWGIGQNHDAAVVRCLSRKWYLWERDNTSLICRVFNDGML